jgi:hypothetical protein
MRFKIAVLPMFLVTIPCLIFAQIPTNGNLPSLTNDIIYIDATKETAQNDKIYNNISGSAKVMTSALSGTVTIPVVVHIIHDLGSENISDAQVATAISQLNDGFRGRIGGVDMQLEFCLAKQDPSGNFTSGINRVQSTLTSLTMETDDHALKSLSVWDPTRYINLWIVRSIVSTSNGAAVAAYSTMPVSHGLNDDGIVIEAGSFGTSLELSRIVIHNFGHFLGLYHTFEGGCKNDNCQLDGDRVCDTPPDGTTLYTDCATSINSCDTDDDDLTVNNPFRPANYGGIGDQPDLISNYMDYNFLYCLNSFTLGQKDRITAVLQSIRSSLLVSGVCNSGCPFSLSPSYTVPSTDLQTGSIVTFNNTTTPGSGLTYEWYVNNSLFSTVKTPVYTFSQPGEFIVKLVTKGSPSVCVAEYSKTFKITCPLKSDFTPTGTFARPGTKISFLNTSTGPFTSASWLINNAQVSQGTNLDYTFNQAGFYTVSLIISSGICQSRRDLQVEINSCPQIGKRANYWYFGNGGGISFSSGIATSLANSPSLTNEGSSSISDENGNFLFSVIPIAGGIPNYSTSVKDRNHAVMPGGAGLVGGTSSSQFLIVPHPGNSNLYYIFGAYERASGGLYYSIVDMSKNNGLGDVTTKNIKLHDFTSEKMAATLHSNGRDYWVVTHPWNSGEFHTYLINQSGLSTTPVISTAGTLLSGDATGACGVMKISPNGKVLAMAAQYDPGSYVEAFDFDNNTGKISNFVKIDNLPQAYGLEFSPDASKLYVSCGWNSQSDGGLFQYNVAVNSSQEVINSKYLVSAPPYYGQMQLGPDGRIYFSKVLDRFMGVIQNPNKTGIDCDYDPWGFMLEAYKKCYYGLPSFVSNFVVPNRARISGPNEACPNAAKITYQLTNVLSQGTTVLWSVSGQASLVSQSTGTAVVTFKSTGTARLISKITFPCGVVSDTLNINVRNPSVNLGPDFPLCTGSSFLLNAGPGFLSYRWQNGSTAPTFRATQAGTYSVQVTSAGGCVASDNIIIAPVKAASTLELGIDRTVCPGNIVVLDAGAGFSNYRWQDGSTNQTITAFAAGSTPGITNLYTVSVTDLCGNTASDEVRITFDTPHANAGPDVSTCIGEPVILRGTGSGICHWYDASGNQIGATSEITVRPLATTFYTFKVEANGCSNSDNVTVTVTADCDGCTINAGTDKIICSGQPALLEAVTNGHCSRSSCSNRTPSLACLSGCTMTLTGSMNVSVPKGQTACIPAGTVFTGSVTLTGGTLIVCGTAKMTNFSMNSGRVVVSGDLNIPGLSINGTFENYGTTGINYDCTVNPNSELVNYGTFSIKGSLSSNGRTSNYSVLVVSKDFSQNNSDIFTNECTLTLGNLLHVNGTFINRGTITSAGAAFINSGSQLVADDGSLFSIKNIFINGHISGGTAGYASISVSENTNINGSATISGLLDICDKNGIEVNSGVLAKTVTTDCRCVTDGSGGTATFVWTDSTGKVVGTGKQVSVTPSSTSVYTVTATDVNGNRISDQITVIVNNCK